MPRPSKVEVGDRYGRLLVTAELGSRQSRGGDWRRWYECRCECGASIEVLGKALRNGHRSSCGCLLQESHAEFGRRNAVRERSHGHTSGGRTRIYRTWEAMLRRCRSETSSDYPRYGAVGVTVCSRWDSFETFLEDMGERPEGRTLDRIDPEGNYEPTNCRWATPREQRLNRRAKVVI